MNIAFFSKYLPSDQPGGVSVQVDRLADALVGRGHSVTCFSFSPRPENARYNHVPLQWTATSGAPARLLKKFIPAVRFSKVNTDAFDIRHFHGDDWLCRGSIARVRTFYGSALFEALHAVKPGRFLYQLLFYKLEWLSCLRRGTLVAISGPTRRALPLVRHVVPCGVPLDRYTPLPSLKTEHPSVLFIGDFSSRKQGSLLLRTFTNIILPRFPRATLTVIGPESVTANNVRCVSKMTENELIGEYRKAWVCCMPSSYEGFGVPVIEAMACGTAVVAVDTSGAREIIENNRNGLLCSPDGLGECLKTALEKQKLRDSLVREGLKTAKEYDIRLVAERYEAIYENAVGGGI